MNVTLTPLEQWCLAEMRGIRTDGPEPPPEEAWLAFGLTTMLEVCRIVRDGRRDMLRRPIERKPDGTPTTPLERHVEERVRRRLTEFSPLAGVLGEETGGTMIEQGVTAAVDPIDGTWAFLNGTEQFASTLALFLDGSSFLGLVASPANGELAYGGHGIAARIVRLSVFGEPDEADQLPLRTNNPARLLVNMHPNRAAPSVAEELHRAWSAGDVRAYRAAGGSPSWGMVEAAKGRYTYVNLWTSRPAQPFDLVAPTEVMRAAGGEVIGLDEAPIDAARHAGPFVAGVEDTHRRKVAEIVRNGLARSATPQVEAEGRTIRPGPARQRN